MRTMNFFIFFLCLLCTSGCASRKFVISSYPEGAYIIGYGETSQDKPVEETLVFLGKSDKYDFVAMKRGYYPDTLTVKKESSGTLHFQMIAIEGSPAPIRQAVELKLQNTYMLPVNVEMVLHKGVGNLDKYVKSEEMSLEVSSILNDELRSLESDSSISLICMSDTSGWYEAQADLETYLQSLSTDLLAYYPEAPSVIHILERYSSLFSPVLERLEQAGGEKHLVYGWCKSIKPTSGRVIGNIAVAAGSAAVTGYETAVYGYPVTYSDPSAFALDNSTLFVAYIIDPGSGEVRGIKQHMVPYDIAKEKRVKTLANGIMLFPLAEKTPEP